MLLEARGIQFSDIDDLMAEKQEVEAFLSRKLPSERARHWEEWMENTDVSDCEEDILIVGKSDSELYSTSASNFNRVELSSCMIPGLLEDILTHGEFSDSRNSAVDKKKRISDVLRPHPIIFSGRPSSCGPQTPVAPVGGESFSLPSVLLVRYSFHAETRRNPLSSVQYAEYAIYFGVLKLLEGRMGIAEVESMNRNRSGHISFADRRFTA